MRYIEILIQDQFQTLEEAVENTVRKNLRPKLTMLHNQENYEEIVDKTRFEIEAKLHKWFRAGQDITLVYDIEKDELIVKPV